VLLGVETNDEGRDVDDLLSDAGIEVLIKLGQTKWKIRLTGCASA
jgi:hypothetical protein